MNTHQAARPTWRSIVPTVVVINVLGFLSGRLSNSGDGNPWFDALVKPGIMPPTWAFPVAWTTLYTFLGIALAVVLAAPPSSRRRLALILFVAQLLLNFAWSPVFFGLGEPRAALVIMLVMLGLAIGATRLFARIRPLAAWLMMPYLAWLAFATLLTYRIIELNPSA